MAVHRGCAFWLDWHAQTYVLQACLNEHARRGSPLVAAMASTQALNVCLGGNGWIIVLSQGPVCVIDGTGTWAFRHAHHIQAHLQATV